MHKVFLRQSFNMHLSQVILMIQIIQLETNIPAGIFTKPDSIHYQEISWKTFCKLITIVEINGFEKCQNIFLTISTQEIWKCREGDVGFYSISWCPSITNLIYFHLSKSFDQYLILKLFNTYNENALLFVNDPKQKKSMSLVLFSLSTFKQNHYHRAAPHWISS